MEPMRSVCWNGKQGDSIDTESESSQYPSYKLLRTTKLLMHQAMHPAAHAASLVADVSDYIPNAIPVLLKLWTLLNKRRNPWRKEVLLWQSIDRI